MLRRLTAAAAFGGSLLLFGLFAFLFVIATYVEVPRQGGAAKSEREFFWALEFLILIGGIFLMVMGILISRSKQRPMQSKDSVSPPRVDENGGRTTPPLLPR